MGKVLIGTDYGSYSFNATLKQVTFVLPNNATLSLERVLLISNVVQGVIIYNFSNPSLGATLSGNVLTLDYDTTTHSNSDALQIWYYAPDAVAVSDNEVAEIVDAIKKMTEVFASRNLTFDAGLRLRTITDTSSSINTVSTLSNITTGTIATVTSLNQFGGLSNITTIPSLHQTPVEIQMQKIIVT